MLSKPFIVAEVSGSHLASFDLALRIIDAAADAGADAVKLQTFTPEQMAESGAVMRGGQWNGYNLVDLYQRAHTPRAWHRLLFKHAHSRDMQAFSSVFHRDDVDFLESLDCPRYKIASFELTDHALIAYAASTGKPLIMSTGMATFEEIEIAVLQARAAGCQDLTVLKCTSAYPASPADANLAAGVQLGRWLAPTKWGISDHTLGIGVAVAAAALGAAVIEKHLTMLRVEGGPDASFSMEPHEFMQMVKECRHAAEAIGEIKYGPTISEEPYTFLRRPSGGKRGTWPSG